MSAKQVKCERCGRVRPQDRMIYVNDFWGFYYRNVCAAKESCKQYRKKNKKMINDIYGINIAGLTAGELKDWVADVPDNYKLNLYELENDYGADETIILAVKPK